MKSLGMKYDQMYPTATPNEKSYPTVCLPLSFVDGKDIDVGNEVMFMAKGKVSRIEKTDGGGHVQIQLESGDVSVSEEESEDKEDEKTLLSE